ncbi:MAG: DUF493 domain-containing protein [Pseudomonadota bacterium]
MTESGKPTAPGEPTVDEQGDLVFPCRYPVKAMTRTEEQALEQVVGAVSAQGITLDRETIQLRPSRNGTFQSITLQVEVTSRTQLEQIYAALRALDVVVMTL